MFNNQVMKLPYPEQPPDPTIKLSGTQLLDFFFVVYNVPQIHWAFWRTVNLVVDPNLTYPACMVSQTKTLSIRPEYTNPGVVAHEFAHLSYYQLDNTQKQSFEVAYFQALGTDALLKFLYSQKEYMKTSTIEAHAEIYRYLGKKMPELLKGYYPKLMS